MTLCKSLESPPYNGGISLGDVREDERFVAKHTRSKHAMREAKSCAPFRPKNSWSISEKIRSGYEGCNQVTVLRIARDAERSYQQMPVPSVG